MGCKSSINHSLLNLLTLLHYCTVCVLIKQLNIWSCSKEIILVLYYVTVVSPLC